MYSPCKDDGGEICCPRICFIDYSLDAATPLFSLSLDGRSSRSEDVGQDPCLWIVVPVSAYVNWIF